MTDEVFAAVQAARGVPTGRHKRWSEHYVFDALDAEQADAVAGCSPTRACRSPSR